MIGGVRPRSCSSSAFAVRLRRSMATSHVGSSTPGALPPQDGKDCLRGSHHAEQIDVEQGPNLADRGFLGGAQQTDPGVVDQDIDPAGLREHRRNERIDRLIVGHAGFEITARHRDLIKVGRKGGEVVTRWLHH